MIIEPVTDKITIVPSCYVCVKSGYVVNDYPIHEPIALSMIM